MNKLCFYVLMMLSVMGFSQEMWRPFGSQDDFNQATFSYINGIPGINLPSDVDDLGRIYVAYSENNIIKMRRFANNFWEDFATPINDVTKPIMLDVTNSGTPYIVCLDAFGIVKLIKFNGTNWETIGNTNVVDTGASHVSFCLDQNEKPYVAYSDASVVGKIVVKKFNDTNWVVIGTTGFSSNGVRNTSMAIDSFNMPYVSFADTTLNKVTLKKFNGISWETIGNEGFSNICYGFPQLGLDGNNVPYVIYNDRTVESTYGRISVQKFDGTSWVYLGYNTITTQPGEFLTVAFDSYNIPYINYAERYGRNGWHNKTSVKRFVGASWELVGPATFSFGETINNNFVIHNNEFYSFCIDMGNKNRITVRKLSQNNWKIVGCAGIARGVSKIVFDSNDAAYTVGIDSDNNSHLYKKINGTDWLPIANNFWFQNKMLFDSNNVLYLQTGDVSYPIKRFVNGVIENIGNSAFSNYSSLDFTLGLDNFPYVVYIDNAAGDKITVKKYNGVTWEVVGIAGFSENKIAKPFIAVRSDNVPFVAYIDKGSFNLSTNIFVKKFDGTNWVNPTNSTSYLDAGSVLDFKFDSSNMLYINYKLDGGSNTNLRIQKFNSITWQLIYNQPLQTSSIGFGEFEVDRNDVPYLVLYNTNLNHFDPFINVYKFNSPNWDMIGSNFINTYTNRPSISFSLTNIPCVSYSYITNFGLTPNKPSGGYAKYFGVEGLLDIIHNSYSFNKIKIYPNPVKKTFSISGNEAVNEIEIYDLIGKSVLHQKNVTNEINIENLPNGIYVAKIKTEKGIYSTKLIKE